MSYFEECGFIKEITKENTQGKYSQIPRTTSVILGGGCCGCQEQSKENNSES